MNLSNKAVGLFNLTAFFHNLEFMSFLKDLLHHFVNPAVVFNLKHSVLSSSIFNFKTLFFNVDIEKFSIGLP